MNNIKTILFFLFVLLAMPSAFAQIDINQYFDQNSIPLINRSKPLKVEFKWDMDGRSQSFLNEGLNYLEEGNLTLSLINIDSFVTRNYKAWIGHYYRGQVLMRLSRFKEAEIEFSSVIKSKASLVEGYIELSEALERQHDLSKAKEQLLKAADINPKYVYTYYKLGNLALESRQPNEALAYYKKCNKVDSNFPDAYMARGIISYLKDKKYEEAISLINKSIQVDSAYAPPYFWRGMVYLQENDKQKCIESWNQFLKHNPRNQFVKTLRGFLNTELGNYEAAFADFRKILQNTNVDEDKYQAAQTALDKRIDLQFAANYLIQKGYGLKEEALTNLKSGFCLMVLGNDRNAIDYLKKAERMATSPVIYFLMAIAFEHGGAHNAAFEYYSKTIEYDNDVFDAHKKRAVYLSELKQWDAAYKDINEMLRIQPNTPTAYRLKGFMESNQGKYAEAIKYLTLFIQTDSSDVEALRNRALCYSLTNQFSVAHQDFTRLSKINHSQQFLETLINEALAVKDTLNGIFLLKKYYKAYNTMNSLIEISQILIAQKKYTEVAEFIEVARTNLRETEKNNRVVLHSSSTKSDLSLIEGMVAFNQSRFEEAVNYLTASLKENPNNLESKYLRGKCFVQISNLSKALKDFEALKKENYKDAEALYNSLKNK